MTADHGNDTRTGRMPALNTERVYRTTVPAEELARALADHFRAQEFEVQVFRTTEDRTVMQARKESLWRSEEHTSELQSLTNLVCRLLLEKKKKKNKRH